MAIKVVSCPMKVVVFHRYVSVPVCSVISKDLNGGSGLCGLRRRKPNAWFRPRAFLLRSHPPNMHDSTKRGYHGNMIDQLGMIFVPR